MWFCRCHSASCKPLRLPARRPASHKRKLILRHFVWIGVATRLVATRRMAQRHADWEIDTMKDVLATLESLRDRLPPTHQQELFGESTS